jgi:hypothetical protein
MTPYLSLTEKGKLTIDSTLNSADFQPLHCVSTKTNPNRKAEVDIAASVRDVREHRGETVDEFRPITGGKKTGNP